MKAGAETLDRCKNHYELILNANKRLAKRIQELREEISRLKNEPNTSTLRPEISDGNSSAVREAFRHRNSREARPNRSKD